MAFYKILHSDQPPIIKKLHTIVQRATYRLFWAIFLQTHNLRLYDSALNPLTVPYAIFQSGWPLASSLAARVPSVDEVSALVNIRDRVLLSFLFGMDQPGWAVDGHQGQGHAMTTSLPAETLKQHT